MRSTAGRPVLQLQATRVQPLGAALGALPTEVYSAVDRAEPEWPVLERLAISRSPAAILAGLALALSDFQLGVGGANLYWREVLAVLNAQGTPRMASEVGHFLTEVLSRPVCARLRTLKRERLNRLLRSHIPGRLERQSLAELGEQPLALWHDLATVMEQVPQAKTVAFAMKMFDLMHRIATGKYVAFPSQVPIVADLRIARISFSSGLLAPPDGQTVAVAMAHGGHYASTNTGEIIAAWAQVSDQAQGVSLFRIDSLIWQVAGATYMCRSSPSAARSRIRATVEGYGANPKAAAEVADELTFAL